MASQIYEKIFERNIEQFVALFSEDSSVIYRNEKNKLIHPGEYGRYREDACKNLLRLILDKSVDLSDGFVFTSDNNITTQCDIIIYNANISPIIADGISRMFPAEEVRIIGEIKSTLSKQDYISALRKLADNKKKIIEGRKGVLSVKKGPEYQNTIGSFLVCNKLDFNYDNITYEEIYENIDRAYWHNAILSVEDACFNYQLKFSDFSEKTRKKLEESGFNISESVAWQYPIYRQAEEVFDTDKNSIIIKAERKFEHIKHFCANISSCSKEVWIYTYDPIEYLGMSNENLIRKKAQLHQVAVEFNSEE